MIIVNSAGKCDLQVPIVSTIGRGPKGEKGDKGDPGDGDYTEILQLIDGLDERIKILEEREN